MIKTIIKQRMICDNCGSEQTYEGYEEAFLLRMKEAGWIQKEVPYFPSSTLHCDLCERCHDANTDKVAVLRYIENGNRFGDSISSLKLNLYWFGSDRVKAALDELVVWKKVVLKQNEHGIDIVELFK